MAYNESDDQSALSKEIQNVKNDISNLDHSIAELVNKRRLLMHRLADYEYDLKNSK